LGRGSYWEFGFQFNYQDFPYFGTSPLTQFFLKEGTFSKRNFLWDFIRDLEALNPGIRKVKAGYF